MRVDRFTLGTRFVATLCAVALLVAPGLVRAQGEVTLGAESPEQVVERMKAAGEAEDFAAMAALIAPEDRAVVSLTMIMMAGMVMAFAQMGSEMVEGMAEGMSEEDKAAAEEERKAAMEEIAGMESRFEAVLEKHGLQDAMEQDLGADADPQEVFRGVDQVALIRDLTTILDELPGEEESGPAGPMEAPVGDLEDLKVDGDTATGMLDGEKVEFVKVDGRWYVSLGLKEKLQDGMGGMPMGAGAGDEPAPAAPDQP